MCGYTDMTYEQKYLRIVEEDKRYGFVVRGLHCIEYTDIAITNIEYDEYFKRQREGKQYRLINKENRKPENGLFGYVEEGSIYEDR